MNKTIITILLLFSIPASMPGQHVNESYLLGEARYSEGMYQKAFDHFDQAVLSDPDNYRYILRRAESRFALGDYPGALGDLELLEGANRNEGWLLAARVHARMGNTDKCIESMTKHLRSDQKQSESTILLDPAFETLERNRDWIRLWSREWYSKEERMLGEARYLIKSGDFVDALEYLNEQLAVRGRQDDLLALRAQTFYGLGNDRNCISDVTEAIGSNSGETQYYLLRAQAYSRQGKHDKAVRDYTRAIQDQPEHFELYLLRAENFQAAGNLIDAAGDIEFLLNYFPGNERLMYRSGMLYYNQGKYIQALEKFNQLLSSHTGSASYFKARGDTYFETELYRFAIRDYSMALDLDPRNGDSYLKKGLARYYTGDLKGACIDWEMALRLESAPAGELLKKHCQ